VLLDEFSRLEHLASAWKTKLALRVAEVRWKSDGERSPAAWLAKKTGTTVGAASATLETAARLEDLDDVDAAFRAGELSGTEANEMAQAAAVDPNSQAELLAAAKVGLPTLQKRCREVIASSQDELERDRRLKAKRFLKTWAEPDGLFRVSAGVTPEVGAAFLAVLAPYEAEAFDRARAEDRREPYAAYAADAFEAMVAVAAGGGTKGRAPAQVNVVIPLAALQRGYAEGDETVEIAGVGRTTVARVQEIIDSSDPFLTAVVTDGKDVYNVAHLGRKPLAHQRTALMVRDRFTCRIDDCTETRNLEIDHVEEWSKTLRTFVRELALLCHFHHRQKTVGGYTLRRREDGGWDWLPPARPPP
jgi:hypothetical protein